MPNKLQIKFIADCLANLEVLTSWEQDFIRNISVLIKYNSLFYLSPAQNSTLNKCIAKVNAATAAPARDSNKYANKQPRVPGGFDEYN